MISHRVKCCLLSIMLPYKSFPPPYLLFFSSLSNPEPGALRDEEHRSRRFHLLPREQDYTSDPVVKVVQLWGKAVEQAHEDPIQRVCCRYQACPDTAGMGVARCQDGDIELWRLTCWKVGSPMAICSAQPQLRLVLAQPASSVVNI